MKLLPRLILLLIALLSCSNKVEGLEVEYVVAHYKENLSWLIPYANQTHLYHKGSLRHPPFPVAEWTPLNNVGREGQTYLFHIVNHYDDLAEITFFLQGRFSDHAKGKSLDEALKEATESGLSFLGDSTLPFDCHGPHTPPEQFWYEVFREVRPNHVLFYPGACFAVRRELIYRYPKEFYEKLLEILSHHVDPLEGYYVERLWWFIFDPQHALEEAEAPGRSRRNRSRR